jgi:hypothetical protein
VLRSDDESLAVLTVGPADAVALAGDLLNGARRLGRPGDGER